MNKNKSSPSDFHDNNTNITMTMIQILPSQWLSDKSSYTSGMFLEKKTSFIQLNSICTVLEEKRDQIKFVTL